MFRRFFVVALVLSSVVACAPSPEAMQAALSGTLAAMPTATAYPTYTAQPSQTPYPTLTPAPTLTAVVMVVTATATETPQYTPTATEPPTMTPDPLHTTKGPGIYLVNVDIGPGVWRNDGKSDDCYWKVSTETGDTIDNFFGQAGGTIYIPASGFQVELQADCGNWTFLK